MNSAPHIGHALEMIQADAIARYQRLRGKKVIFNTGTDEHGLKIFRKAEERGITAQEFCDENAAHFRALKESLNLSFTHFIRTTDEHHIAAAQEFWRRCAANGDIYKKNYKVKYCVGCELEKTESELNEEGRCPVHPNLDVEEINEENYFFKFSNYQEKLLQLYNEVPDFVLPAHRLTEIKRFTEKGLQDFSISRLKEKMPWGVPVPDDADHVMYVWFDALVNYVSTLGWPEESGEFNDFWLNEGVSNAIQIAGKDNLRQQSNMWQGMLMSAGVAPSRQILIHGFITSGGQKMSKSLGNVVDPFAVAEQFGIDPLRMYLLKEIPTAEDGDFSQERFRMMYNEMANNLGNLLSRTVAMTEKYFDGVVPTFELDNSVENAVSEAWSELDARMNGFDLKKAIEAAWAILDLGNRYVDDHKPWTLAKEEKLNEVENVLGTLLELLRQTSWMLYPFIPEATDKMRVQLGVDESLDEGAALREWGGLKAGTKVAKGEGLFPRLES